VPPVPPAKRGTIASYIQNTILAGLLAAFPLVVTWFVISFLIRIIMYLGKPAITMITEQFVQPWFPGVADFVLHSVAEGVLAVLLVIIVLFVLGILARQVARGRLVQLFHAAVERIPLANKVYGATRKLVESLQSGTNGMQRVVLIDFPSPEMKTIGLVTRTMKDSATGEELAAVFVPTTPNPTNGYLEIVPVAKLTLTNLSMDEAMTFVISGGAVGPTHMAYRQSVKPSQAKS
jgi:uncharacterized membrane protein